MFRNTQLSTYRYVWIESVQFEFIEPSFSRQNRSHSDRPSKRCVQSESRFGAAGKRKPSKQCFRWPTRINRSSKGQNSFVEFLSIEFLVKTLLQAYLVLVRLFDLNVMEPIDNTGLKTEAVEEIDINTANFADFDQNSPQLLDDLPTGTEEVIFNAVDQLDTGTFQDWDDEIPKKRRKRKSAQSKDKNYACDQCDKKFLSPQGLTRHKTNMHETNDQMEKLSCEICQEKFSNKSELRAHKKSHAPDKHHCDQCGKAFKTIQTLNAHCKSVHSEIVHPCDICGLMCASKKLLKAHHDRPGL